MKIGMELTHMCLNIFSLFILIHDAISSNIKSYPLLMPNVNPDREELYLCTPVKVQPNRSFYIVGFEPNATMDTVHHMILLGCQAPGATVSQWDCGEMAAESRSQDRIRASPCAEGSHVIYAWARDADKLQLPHDVGFEVGFGTNIAYLVLQVHYARKFPKFYVDNSGINLIYTETPQNKLAGVVLLATGGRIPQHGITHMESECRIDEDKVIIPFAYRTHTHSLGKVVSGYVVKPKENGDYKWIELGKRNPLTPQMFYPTFTNEPIVPGDILASRCTMDSTYRDRETLVGATNNDEMCNFYLMYFVDRGKPLDMKYCVTQGPPLQSWLSSKYQFNHIPDEEASML